MIDIVLLVLKIGILVLLYLFIWRVVTVAIRSVRDLSGGAPAPDVPLPGPRPAAAVFTPEERDGAPRRPSQRAHHGRQARSSTSRRTSTRGWWPKRALSCRPAWCFRCRAGSPWAALHASDIVLDESFVSSTHARLVPRGQFYYVEDLGSTNGTWVNDKRVDEAQLKLDSRVRIGETVFRYEE